MLTSGLHGKQKRVLPGVLGENVVDVLALDEIGRCEEIFGFGERMRGTAEDRVFLIVLAQASLLPVFNVECTHAQRVLAGLLLDLASRQKEPHGRERERICVFASYYLRAYFLCLTLCLGVV